MIIIRFTNNNLETVETRDDVNFLPIELEGIAKEIAEKVLMNSSRDANIVIFYEDNKFTWSPSDVNMLTLTVSETETEVSFSGVDARIDQLWPMSDFMEDDVEFFTALITGYTK